MELWNELGILNLLPLLYVMNFEQDTYKFGATVKNPERDLKKAVAKASHSNQNPAISHG